MNRRFAIVLALVMSFAMSLFMSGIVTAINLGVSDGFVRLWLEAWLKVFPIAFVAIMLFRPLATKLTIRLVGPAGAGPSR